MHESCNIHKKMSKTIDLNGSQFGIDDVEPFMSTDWFHYNTDLVNKSFSQVYTVKTRVSFRHSLRHRNGASASVVSTLKSVFLREKTTLLSVKTTLRLSYQVLKMTL
jgi:hypothetical protein